MEKWQEEWYEREIEDEMPLVGDSDTLTVTKLHRLTSDENGPSPGYRMFKIWVENAEGNPVHGLKIAFTTMPSEGQAYEHPNAWGTTDENGYLEWQHLGIPTSYEILFEDGMLDITNIITNLRNEYPRGGVKPGSWRPTCGRGRFSFRIEVQLKVTE